VTNYKWFEAVVVVHFVGVGGILPVFSKLARTMLIGGKFAFLRPQSIPLLEFGLT
jgi:hypothetical protein